MLRTAVVKRSMGLKEAAQAATSGTERAEQPHQQSAGKPKYGLEALLGGAWEHLRRPMSIHNNMS
jgi:hypothetical protein